MINNGESKMESLTAYEAEVSRQGERELAARKPEKVDHLVELGHAFTDEEIEQVFFWMETSE